MRNISGRHAKLAKPLVLLTVLLTMGACGQQEVLEPVRGQRPTGLDLSGEWRLVDDYEAMLERIDRAVMDTDGVDEREILRGMMSAEREQRSRRSRSSRKVGGLVHVFLENGRRLRITQTDAGLFIAFDRSVVEEYRFGEARMVSTGGARAQRVSGWDGESYVIETLDENGMKLSERYSLADGGETLRRDIVLRSAELEEVAILQTFRRE
jgi:hypothetical protein